MRLMNPAVPCLFALSLLACPPGPTNLDGGMGDETVSKTLGAGGGSIDLAGATFTFPSGTLAADTLITLVKSSGGVPEGYTAQTAVFTLKPQSLKPAKPIAAVLDFTGDASLYGFLAKADGAGFEKVYGKATGQKLSLSLTRLGAVFAGRSPDPALSMDELGPAQFDAYCKHQSLCSFMSSKERCLSYVAEQASLAGGNFDTAGLKKAVAAGRKRYDGQAAKKCFDTVGASSSCDTLGPTLADALPECSLMVAGTVDVGGGCYDSGDCATGFCSAEAKTCPGLCVAFKKVGDPVTPGQVCEPGSSAVDGRCVAAVSPGAGCAPISPSIIPQPCTRGHYCNINTLKCTAVGTEGSPCSAGAGDCAANLYCKTTPPATTGSCARRATAQQACSSGVQCTYDLTCLRADWNAQSGSCTPLRGLDESCVYGSDCKTAFYCNSQPPTAGQCKALVARGGTCTATTECSRDDYCPTATTKCTERKALGGACQAQEECQFGLACTDNKCAVTVCQAP